MKSFTKKIIWFFGYGLFEVLRDFIFYITHGVPTDLYFIEDVFIVGNFIVLFVWIFPLFFMKDDKRIKK